MAFVSAYKLGGDPITTSPSVLGAHPPTTIPTIPTAPPSPVDSVHSTLVPLPGSSLDPPKSGVLEKREKRDVKRTTEFRPQRFIRNGVVMVLPTLAYVHKKKKTLV